MLLNNIIKKIEQFLIKIPLIDKIFKFIRYSMVGGLCALIDYTIFFIALTIFNLNYLYALAASLLITEIVSFILLKHFTFRNKSNQYIKQISKFLFVDSISITLNFILMYIFVGLILVNPLIARIITIFLMWPINFSMHNFFTFRK